MEDNPYKQAEVRARALRDFLIHLLIFVPSAGLLLLFQWLAGESQTWINWLLLFWLFGLGLHGISLLNPFARVMRLLDEDRLRDRSRR
ncbi:2TM domain-containing protein [Gammaproteobacteria bacterium AB-CW1]|uniref:2TM domain-containing protein n=1 Tax=Natronospira elongata TaxID=3110268 RepID=A0AAP6JER7_9GAMM|nr:2TM domain-containing protein [Gammaproteobacteria bacterium AB-CW1]